ncbi:MAG: DUF2231 domain-containing protein [Gammaproteobacteria bacterium]
MNELFLQYFPGIGEMANIHPVLVHFPIALLSGFLFAELLSLVGRNQDLRVAAKWMLYFGTLGAVASAIMGLLGAEHVFHEGEVHAQMSRHRDYGLNVVALSLFLCIWRVFEGRDLVGLSRIIQNGVGVLMIVNLMFGADLGGSMVYHYGVAVQAVSREDVDEEEAHEHGGIGGEIMEWVHGFFEEEHEIRTHSH